MIGIDMKMPNGCWDCDILDAKNWQCPITHAIAFTRKRLSDCPLHPLDDGIRVGDEVRLSEMLGVVINIWTDYTGTTLYDVFRHDGKATVWEAKQCTKTDRHFDEVETLFQKMRGEDDG